MISSAEPNSWLTEGPLYLASFVLGSFGNIFSSLCTLFLLDASWVGCEPKAAPLGPRPLATDKRGFTCKTPNARGKPIHIFHFNLWTSAAAAAAVMSLGAERRMETRQKKLEDMIRDPRSSVNLESLLVSQVGCTSWIINDAKLSIRWNARHVRTHAGNVILVAFMSLVLLLFPNCNLLRAVSLASSLRLTLMLRAPVF